MGFQEFAQVLFISALLSMVAMGYFTRSIAGAFLGLSITLVVGAIVAISEGGLFTVLGCILLPFSLFSMFFALLVGVNYSHTEIDRLRPDGTREHASQSLIGDGARQSSSQLLLGGSVHEVPMLPGGTLHHFPTSGAGE